MKNVILIMLLCALATFSKAQCPNPTFQWKQNKNAFVIDGVPFTGDTAVVRWKDPNATLWNTVTGQLHRLSTLYCPNANNCHYDFYVVKNTYVGALFYGVQDGWQVQVGIKCNGNITFSNVETVHNVK